MKITTIPLPLVEDPAELWRGWGRIKVGVDICIVPLTPALSRQGRGDNRVIFYILRSP
jgi:hypothetical protein